MENGSVDLKITNGNEYKYSDYWSNLLAEMDVRQALQRLTPDRSHHPQKLLGDMRNSNILTFPYEISNFLKKMTSITKPDTDSILLAVWHLTLSAYSYSLQTLVGIVANGETEEQTILPHILTHEFENGTTLQNLIHRVEETVENLIQQGRPKSAELQRKVAAVIDHVFTNSLKKIKKINKSHLCVVIATTDSISVEYCLRDLDEVAVLRLLGTYKYILQQFTNSLNLEVTKIKCVPEDEERDLLKNIQDPRFAIPLDATLLSIFEQQSLKTPHNTAVVYGDIKITYKILDEKVNQLAHYIQKSADLKQNCIIALCTEPSDSMIIAILAVWKVGGAYVAVDPNYDNERMEYILEDSGAILVLVDEVNKDKIKTQANRKVLVVQDAATACPDIFSKPSSNNINYESMSHLIYTSGTTGRPKGVRTLHKGLICECIDYTQRYHLETNEVLLLVFNYVFNAFSEPLTLALSNGFPLVVVPKSMLFETQKLYEYASNNAVTHIDASPSFISRMNLSKIKSLKRVALGGEILTRDMYERIKLMAPNVDVFNVFGISEGTLGQMTSDLKTYTTAFQRPVVNKQVLVLSRNLKPVPVGAIGEICLSGAGVCQGYHNNEKLTKMKFITGPNCCRMFRTGDLGRRLCDSSIEYIGREDFQIKIRGYRVELGEIESVIRNFPGVISCVTLAKNADKSAEVSLASYYVSPVIVEESDLLNHLKKHVPEYMIPGSIKRIDTMPLTANGKVDRVALQNMLPQITKEKRELKKQDVEICPIQVTIHKIWQEVLHLTEGELCSTDNFFEIGGNSLLAMTLAETLNEKFHWSLDSSYIFMFPSVEEFCGNLLSVN